jgi:hypothetical protein
MEREAQRREAEALDRYWDAILSGTQRAQPPEVGAAPAALIRRVHSLGAPPPGLEAAQARIWSQLMHRTSRDREETSFASTWIVSSRPPRIESNGRAGGLPDGKAPPGVATDRRRWMVAQLATAALVLLTLVAGFVAFRGPLHLMGQQERPAFIPAIDSTPESMLPSGVTADSILLRSTLEEMPPPEGTLQLALYRNRLAPGAVEPAGSQADTGVSNDLCTIESGRVTVEADAPVWLIRAVKDSAAAPRRVEPGTAIVLDVGDQLLTPSGVTFRRRNDGLTSATTLCFSIGTYGDSARLWASPPGVMYVHGLPFKLLSVLPAVPVEATVRRMMLAPGAELALRDLPGLELVYVEAGALDLVYAQAETPATPERAFTIRAGSGTETFGRTPEQAVLANRGAEPLVILTAAVIPASTDEATPQAP